MNNEELLRLIERIANNAASDEDIKVYNAWCNSFQEKGEAIPDFSEIQSQMILNIRREIYQKPAKTLYPFYRIAVAASILFCCSIGFYFYQHKSTNSALTARHSQQDIAPGSNKAILTLANGQKISLTDAKNGTIAKENQVAINKTADGQVVYAATATATATINTLETPRGGQYHLTLADGTQVWLNSASSLKYPSAFTGKVRKVELTGEAYFEVAHNSAMSFRVLAAGETVEDLGTHFNINAYTDEPAIKTTLLEGSVKVSQVTAHNSRILTPGQQSQIKIGEITNKIDVSRADPEEAIAWKNGYFKFEGEDLKSVMRKVSRWYNVDVEYEGNFGDNISFLGEVSRAKNISAVLKIMQATGNVHFRVAGRRVTVMP